MQEAGDAERLSAALTAAEEGGPWAATLKARALRWQLPPSAADGGGRGQPC
jgi:hypothetical protein